MLHLEKRVVPEDVERDAALLSLADANFRQGRYQQAMARFAGMRNLDVWYAKTDAEGRALLVGGERRDEDDGHLLVFCVLADAGRQLQAGDPEGAVLMAEKVITLVPPSITLRVEQCGAVPPCGLPAGSGVYPTLLLIPFLAFFNLLKPQGFGGTVNVSGQRIPGPGAEPVRISEGKFWLVNLSGPEGDVLGAGGTGGLLALYWKCPHLGCLVPLPCEEVTRYQCRCHRSTGSRCASSCRAGTG